ncbi:CinA family nicotinamide mononucleotide deamidase-related protein [Flavobacteriaceae bacterium]|nr:CinA family nicotinamide mononucleotide deamidase-related protein [Flavobacteriaceae bacterium]MDB2685366.1 CinA family nicotinamide mononucleotide deamidase-related protein [Flavobacteriaceae bacterium]MDB4256697.1 CinA family nicotinamide mononucleotide deamidase-related protein [Flavobacteriaceae bacterium]
MNAEIITIGDEILIGQIVDTNSQWIGKELNKIGVSVYQISSIQDEELHILNAFKEAQSRADIVIITGGLGPTKDDITKKTISKFFNDQEIIEYPEVLCHIKKMFKKYNIPYNKVQQYQAQLPSKARLLMNRMGTAPGMWFYENNTVFVSMPGVPYEMKGLMKHEVIPRIQEQFNLPFIIHKTVMTYGQGESVIAERIEDWANKLPDFIKLAYLPSFGRVRLRLSAKGPKKQVLEDSLHTVLQKLYLLLSDIITGHESGVAIEEHIGNLLKDSKKTLCTAESVTGGKIASTIVSVPGSSVYFNGSIVAYSSKMKQELLHVSTETIKKYSVVSSNVVEEMAISAMKKTNSDYAIAVTGNAGPTSDKTSIAVGIVFIAIASAKGVVVEEFNFGHPREKVINRTVNKSLQMLQQEILKK